MTNYLPITALVEDGIIARTYIAYLFAKGFGIERLLILVHRRHSSRYARVIPSAVQAWYLKRAQSAASLYWVRRLPKQHPETFATLSGSILKHYKLPSDFYSSLDRRFDYRAFAREVNYISINDFKDPALKLALSSLPEGPILFTGGGILPTSIVSDPHRPLIHVHPGLLPDIRGADGLLWSTALLGRPSASCFVMASGIDTGALLATKTFPSLIFPCSSESRPNTQSLYRLVYAYYDPILRAVLLSDVMRKCACEGFSQVISSAKAQDPSVGRTFNFMHSDLRAAVLARIFPEAK